MALNKQFGISEALVIIGLVLALKPAKPVSEPGPPVPGTPGSPPGTIPSPGPGEPLPPAPIPPAPGPGPIPGPIDELPPEDELPPPLPPEIPVEPPTSDLGIVSLTLPTVVYSPVSAVLALPPRTSGASLKEAFNPPAGVVVYNLSASTHWQAIRLQMRLLNPTMWLHDTVTGAMLLRTRSVPWNFGGAVGDMSVPPGEAKVGATGTPKLRLGYGPVGTGVMATSQWVLAAGTYTVETSLIVSQFLNTAEGRLVIGEKVITGPALTVRIEED